VASPHARAGAVAPATELLPLPRRGRTYTGQARVRLGDTDPAGFLRLDALARFLQDVANDDARDAGLDNALGWVVRRTMIDVRAPAGLGESLTLTTFCSGFGRSWAERRTTVIGSKGAVSDAVSLWVQVELASGRPTRLGAAFEQLYGEASAGRTVSSRLSLAGPPPEAAARPWPVRHVDLDVFGHVNNAVLWAVLEDVTAGRSRVGVGEIEYPGPVDEGAVVEALVIDGGRPAVWVVEAGTVRCASRWTPGGSEHV
jgi:acyl-ACP thioesterase